MEAKDTVMNETAIQAWCLEFVQPGELDLNAKLKEFAQAQAEISFKAGIEEAQNRLHSPEVVGIAQEALDKEHLAGIREVVEFSNDICVLHGDADARTRQGRVLRKGHCKMCWETQLKAWGIEIDHQG